MRSTGSPQRSTGSPQWIFDPIPPSGAIQGGIPAVHVFQPDLGTFVREVLQNSHDQRKIGEAARVQFTFHRLAGERKVEFLRAAGWSQLETHLRAASTGRTAMAPRLRQALDELSKGPLILLRIDDAGTRGLVGDEDRPGTNFTALCRNVLDTTEDRPQRGGSFGLGKAVLWRFSAFSTVLFSSRIDGEPRPGFRLFGRAELPYHETPEGRWSGPGWYGKPEETPSGLWRAISAWDHEVEELARRSHLFRPAQLGTGTSILVVGFLEPAQEEARSLGAVAEDILNSAARWFWPAITAFPPSLQVSAEVYEDGVRVYREAAGIGSEVQPFVGALSATELVERASRSGQAAERTLGFTVPARIGGEAGPAEPEVDALVNLRLIRSEEEEAGPSNNRVALVRGAGMVVQYWRPPRGPLGGPPFHAVLRAGRARGESETDEALERFLRAAEPPAHNQWIAGTDEIQTKYRRGAKARFDALWRALDGAIVEMCEQLPPPTGEGPSALARLFPLGGTGGGRPDGQKFRVDRLEASLVDGVWRFSGRVVRQRTGEDPWSFTVTVWLDGETGRGEKLRIGELRVEGAAVRGVGESAECDVVPDLREVTFEGETEAVTEDLGLPDLRRTRIRVEVHPRAGGGR